MLKFAAEDFWSASQILDQLSTATAVVSDPQVKERMSDDLGRLIRHCRKLDLPVSVMEMEKLGGLSNVETDGKMSHYLERISSVIHSELSARLFFHIHPNKARYFEPVELFGKEVGLQFASAADDIAEAGKCLACDRSTAAVYHLGRVVEIGLKALAAHLGIGARSNWGMYSQDIDAELKNRLAGNKPKSPDDQFFAEVRITFDAIRIAWRNPTMHVEKTHTVEQAEEIFSAVRQFIRHLATKLHD
jgi:hypothetical protein